MTVVLELIEFSLGPLRLPLVWEIEFEQMVHNGLES